MALLHIPKNPPPPPGPKYPLLEPLLRLQGLPLKASYTVGEAAQLFGVSRRTINVWVKKGKLPSHVLPGYGRFTPEDLEEFLRTSKRPKREEI